MDSNENNKIKKEENNQPDEIGKKESEEMPDNIQAENEINLNEFKIAELEAELNNVRDRFLRKAAEFENYKRRVENDQLNLFKYSAQSFIKKLLPVIDDFERTLTHVEELPSDAKDIDAFKTGIKLVYEKLIKILSDEGVQKIEAEGKPFDVNFHEAIMQRKDDSVPSHTVLDDLENGYIYKDKVIRHSKVIVSEETVEGNKSKNNDRENSGK